MRLYSAITSRDTPVKAIRPRSISMDRSHSRAIDVRSCEMNSIVVPSRRSSAMRSWHCSWNAASPTASTSSTSRMSASRCAATAKPSRMYMPDEYHLTGMSMNGPTPANATMRSSFDAISRRFMPRRDPLRKMFSRPVSSGWKPDPTSINAARRPLSVIVPDVGAVIRESSFSSVLLPAPLWPMMPSVSPRATSKLTSRTAQKSR